MAKAAPAGGIAPTSTRTLWKGAITFGLVHIPVGLHSATQETGLDFDWIDKRSGDRVGYKRVNKTTGKEIAAWEQLPLPEEGKEGLKAPELQMAKQLVDEMTTKWDPENFRDSFREQVMELVEKKAKAGQLMAVTTPEKGEQAPSGATVVDLTEMLRRSLASGRRTPAAKTAPAKAAKAPAKRPAAKAAGRKKAA